MQIWKKAPDLCLTYGHDTYKAQDRSYLNCFLKSSLLKMRIGNIYPNKKKEKENENGQQRDQF